MVITSGNSEMTRLPDTTSADESIKLRRTFTLPRNPFNSTRMSKRKFPSKETDIEDAKVTTDNEKTKKVFRRPSFKKFINKLVQHINGVNVISPDNNRVPTVGLQTWKPDQTPGVTGLINHGNTCFINAVLQCIAHTDILAEYFVLDRYKVDLQKRNKLNSKKFGSKGELTEQLALLLKALWACQYNPELTIAFKQVVEKHGSQYKGRQQHDALEFLQWLLDKVHEDLNTASKKKFKSIKTSGRPDEVIAAETLENYKRCNNSFVQGVFQAQYRSSLSCSRCLNKSNTFDPFQCISVQLPQVNKQSVYVTVLYTSQQPRQVKIGLSIPSGATISELRDVLQSDTSINRANMLITEIVENGFHRTFTDAQSVAAISEADPIYCIEVPRLKDLGEDTTSAYVLLCWINVTGENFTCKKFGSPYSMQVSRETSYDDLQKLILKEMALILHDDILTSNQPRGIFKIRILDPACDYNEPACYLEPHLEHPLFMEAIDQALALCSEEGGPPHVKLVLEWTEEAKKTIIADDGDLIEEHSSVKQLLAQALQGVPLTLEECLRDYTGAETLSDAWRCPHCQQYRPVVKTLDVWSLPDILIVHFKRFRQQTLKGTNTTKLTTMVEFPVYGFDMSPHLAHNKCPTNNHTSTIPESEGILIGNNWSPWRKTRKHSNGDENIYDLYAVCYHHGTNLGTGHYTAACKNPYDNQWYLYDDANVTNLTKQSEDIPSLLVNNSAYILFYQKRNCSYGSSSSSSAASTSSIGSNVDHWVSRMPKFVTPKHLRVEKKAKTEENIESKQSSENEICDKVAFRNSQNTLKSSSNNLNRSEKSTSNVALETDSLTRSRASLNSNRHNSMESNKRKSSNSMELNGRRSADPKPPLYTTSIFINSSGKADIKTTCMNSPVLSSLRTSGLSEDDVEIELRQNDEDQRDKTYLTTASIHRHSDLERSARKETHTSSTHLNWMSPQLRRKITQSQQSM